MESIPAFKITPGFPTLIEPRNPNLSVPEWYELIALHRNTLYQLSLKYGALLFRGFPISPTGFQASIEHLHWGGFVNYIGGDSPRDKVTSKVYTSTEAPPSLLIPLHQELSFMNKYPRHIYFYCEIPPKIGGETIIADARKVIDAIDPVISQAFESKALTYISRYYYKDKIMKLINYYQRSHKSWMEVFETEDKQEVETKCRDNDFEWEWLANNWLQVIQHRPATIHHPETNEPVWFNQAHLYDFNPKLLGFGRYLGAKLFYSNPKSRLHEISFADQSKIPRPYFYHILEILNQQTVKFTWQANDWLVLDNVLAMHGRAPFKGKRRILTALTS